MENQILNLIKKEEKRQIETLMMIPSENYTYPEVRQAVGSVLMHKYSEGYPKKRYYQGNKIIDEVEEIAIVNAKKLFNVPHANVQSYSGSPANSAVLMGLINPGDTIVGMNLASGGHLTHGHPNITFSGKFFKSVQYGVKSDGYIDYDELEILAIKEKPKLIIAGLTAYSRNLDWAKFADISKKVNAYLLADISHIAGLVAGGAIDSPVDFVDVITTTTHKTLRGPRGALIMVTQKGIDRDPDMPKKIDRAVFPGLQGGPHNNTTAGIAIALEKASTKEFADYAKNTINNAKVLAKSLIDFGFDLITGGTDNHLMLIDLRNKNILGKEAAILLEEAGIVVNYNAVPFDPNPPFNPSGIRLGTPALTARGMGESEMIQIVNWINEIIETKSTEKIQNEVEILCKKFPI